MTTQATTRARVRRGVALLDADMPGWRDRIDLTTLEITDPCHCVIGQVYGVGEQMSPASFFRRSFSAEIKRLTGDVREGYKYGFDVNDSDYECGDMQRLQTTWTRELQRT